DFIKAFGWDLRMDGLVTGEAAVSGRRSAPSGSARVTSPAGRYYGVAFADLEVDALLRARATEVRKGRARVGGGTISFHGVVGDDGVYDGSATVTGMDVGELLPPVAGAAWAGRVSGTATVQGPLVRPRLRARFTSPRLFLGDEGVGALEADLVGAGDGAVGVEA